MDEPTSALDPVATTKIEALVQDLASKYTIVIVTHNMQQAARISNRTAFFLTGEILEIDDTKKYLPIRPIQRRKNISPDVLADEEETMAPRPKMDLELGSRLTIK